MSFQIKLDSPYKKLKNHSLIINKFFNKNNDHF